LGKPLSTVLRAHFTWDPHPSRRATKSKHGRKTGVLRGPTLSLGLHALEFLAQVIMHIPEPRRHLIRFYGCGVVNLSPGSRVGTGFVDY
jgi:hypothetical protein